MKRKQKQEVSVDEELLVTSVVSALQVVVQGLGECSKDLAALDKVFVDAVALGLGLSVDLRSTALFVGSGGEALTSARNSLHRAESWISEFQRKVELRATLKKKKSTPQHPRSKHGR